MSAIAPRQEWETDRDWEMRYEYHEQLQRDSKLLDAMHAQGRIGIIDHGELAEIVFIDGEARIVKVQDLESLIA